MERYLQERWGFSDRTIVLDGASRAEHRAAAVIRSFKPNPLVLMNAVMVLHFRRQLIEHLNRMSQSVWTVKHPDK